MGQNGHHLEVYKQQMLIGVWRKGNLCCWWECKLVQPLWKSVGRFLKNLKLELPYDPAIPHLGIYEGKKENTNLKRYMHLYIHSSTVHNSQDMEGNLMFIGRSMDEEHVAHIRSRLLLSHSKRNKGICHTWMDLDHHRSQTEKDKHHRVSLICGI